MLKKLSFIISSTIQNLMKKEESFTIDSVMRNAKKSQSLYDGMYNITEDLLKISDGTTRGSSIVLNYETPMPDGDGEELHLFVIFRRKLFYFHKLDDPEAQPEKSFYKDYETPILIQMEFTSRKQTIFAIKETMIAQHLTSGMDIPEHLDAEWQKLIDFAIQSLEKPLSVI